MPSGFGESEPIYLFIASESLQPMLKLQSPNLTIMQRAQDEVHISM